MKIEQLDGRVGAYPNHPKGSVFWFEIPIIPEHQQSGDITAVPESKLGDVLTSDRAQKAFTGDEVQIDVEKPAPPGPGDAGDEKSEPLSVEELLVFYNIDASRVSVLLVEDEHMLRKFTKKLLERIGFQVDEAGDGADGLRRMQQKAYDVVLMDQNMPQMSGLEAVRLFRAWQAQAETPSPSENDPLIFIVSASILETDRAEAVDLRIAEYLEKPLHVNRIAAQVLAQIAAHPGLLSRCQRIHDCCDTGLCQPQQEDEQQQPLQQEERQQEGGGRSAAEAASEEEEGIR